MSKHEMRKWAKEERKKLNINNLSAKVVEIIQSTQEYKLAQNIMIYYPLKDEINLLSLLKDKNKNFYLPKVSGEDLLCCPYKEGLELCESDLGIKEPLTEPIDKHLMELVIIPALAVDKLGYRLGYGGGFYDRFLENVSNISKFVCIPQALVVETIYPELHDIKIDKIIVV